MTGTTLAFGAAPGTYELLMAECGPVLQDTMIGADSRRTSRQQRARMGDADIYHQYHDPSRPDHPWVTGKVPVVILPWSPMVHAVRLEVARWFGWLPNKVTINHYTPLGYISPHRDIDYDLGLEPEGDTVIASFGAERTMYFTNLLTGIETPVVLPDRSFLLMPAATDRTHTHGIRPELHARGGRLSLAFKQHRLKDAT